MRVRSIREFFRSVVLLAHHPLAIASLPRGRQEVNRALFQPITKDYATSKPSYELTHGFRIYLNPSDCYISRAIWAEGAYEMDETSLFESLMPDARVVVDVGANIGWYTLLGASALGNRGLVLAFEPEPANFSYLAKSVKANHFDNVRLYDCALSNLEGEVKLYLPRDVINPGDHSINCPPKDSKFVTLRALTLDKLAEEMQIRQIDVLKLDVQGAEPLVLKGGEKLLRGCMIRHIIVGWTPQVWKGEETLLKEILNSYGILPIGKHQVAISDPRTLASITNLHLRLRS